MKAILKFNLPEEQQEFDMANKAINYYSSLWEMRQWLKYSLKHAPDDMPKEQYDGIEQCKRKLEQIIANNNLDL